MKASPSTARKGRFARIALIAALSARAAFVRAQCVPDTHLATIPNPARGTDDQFGGSVGVSGNLVVVGAHLDDPGGLTDAGSAYVHDATTGALVATLNHYVPEANDNFGISVAISGTRVVVGAYREDIAPGIADAGTAIVFDATTGAVVGQLNNPTPTANDLFGASVAISGNLAVVGAYGEDPGGVSAAGSAFVFDVITGELVATLNDPVPATNDNFGRRVAISGNVVVVAAPLDDPAGVADAGTAFVFDATTGALVATLNHPSPAASDQLGAVAVSGNLALVGAAFADPGGVTDAGTAYVFDATTGAVVATLNNPAPAASDGFGFAVAISGNTAMVGASADDPGGLGNAGTTFLFDATTGALLSTLNDPAPATSDLFGRSVAISGIVAAVGAIGDDPGGTSNAGSAFTFTCAPAIPTASPTPTITPTVSPTPVPGTCEPVTPQASVPNPAPAANDTFGGSVGVSGNLIVVGAALDDPFGLTDAGTACVFDATTGAIVSTLNHHSPAAFDEFGLSVGISGTSVVVGARREDIAPGIADAGTAIVFDATTGSVIGQLNNPDPTANDLFGHAVAISGNLAVVGAYGDDPGGISGAGTAYVFDVTTGGVVATLNDPAPGVNDQFGASVAISGFRAVVGTHFDDPGGVTDAGSAYVFDATTGAPIATLNNPSPGTNDQFGGAVAIHGNLAVVGAWYDDPGGVIDAGRAFVFDATTGALLAPLDNPSLAASDRFGISVGISANTVLVGSFGEDFGATLTDTGIAYLFEATTGGLLATLHDPEPDSGDFYGASAAIAGNVAVVGATGDVVGGASSAGSAYSFSCTTPTPTPSPSPTVSPTPSAARDGWLYE